MDLQGSASPISPEPFDWQRRDGLPRRLQVNAFGFGGSNYVVQAEQALDGEDTILVSIGREARLTAETADDPAGLPGVSFFRTEMAGRNYPLGVVAPSAARARAARSPVLREAAAQTPGAAHRHQQRRHDHARRQGGERVPTLAGTGGEDGLAGIDAVAERAGQQRELRGGLARQRRLHRRSGVPAVVKRTQLPMSLIPGLGVG